MTRRALFLFVLIVVVFTPGAAARAAGLYAPQQVIVRLQPGTDVALFAGQYGLQVIDQLPGTTVYLLRTPPGVDPAALSSTLARDPRVVWAEPNFFFWAPETQGGQWTSTFDGGTSPGPYVNQRAIQQVDYKTAPARSSGSGVIAAILDTGISTRNAYLQGKVMAGWNAMNNSRQTDDVPQGIDSSGDGIPDEGAGHGTMVAGIVALFAPKTWLLPVKVLDSDGQGDLWGLVKGMRWAVDQGARVLNLSLGMAQRSHLLEETIDETYQRGAAIVTSAGNNNASRPQYPAGYPIVLTVAALDANNAKASFSNYGGMIDVCAPGVNINSTYWNGHFGVGSGTSFSAPFVTAEVALIWSIAPGLSNTDLQQLIRDSAKSVDRVNPGYRSQLGAGIIDIDQGVRVARGQ